MSRKSSTIFLGDLARAVCELGVSDPTTIKLIAGMCGLSVELRDDDRKPPRPDLKEMSKVGTSPTAPSGEDSGTQKREPAAATEAAVEERRAIPVELHLTPGVKEVWIPEGDPSSLPPPDAGPIEAPPLIPLFMPQWTRGILSAALATQADDGLLDIERVTEILARCEEVQRLPTLPSRTLGRGVQLLLDKSQAMMPFVRDQAWLLREIRSVVGTNKVEVLRFIGSPARGAGVGPKPWSVYRPPPPRTPVVLLSDLGICQPLLAADWAGEEEWAEFAGLVCRADCPLIAFVPYKVARWPRSLTRLMTIVPWDRPTTAASVANLLKDSPGAKVP